MMLVKYVDGWTTFLCQETSEVKRKNTKRAFKSEKEFLEFTLKYQQVLAERDSGSLFIKNSMAAVFMFNCLLFF